MFVFFALRGKCKYLNIYGWMANRMRAHVQRFQSGDIICHNNGNYCHHSVPEIRINCSCVCMQRRKRHVTHYCRINMFIVANKTISFFFRLVVGSLPAANLNKCQIICRCTRNANDVQEIQLIYWIFWCDLSLKMDPTPCITTAMKTIAEKRARPFFPCTQTWLTLWNCW